MTFLARATRLVLIAVAGAVAAGCCVVPPHGWGHGVAGTRLSVANEHAGVNSNLLAPADLFDPISNNAAVNGIPVQVSAS